LRADGFDVLKAADARSALALAGADPPDLALLHVPQANGDHAALVRAIRARAPDVPVIALAEADGAGSGILAPGSGFDDFVTVPFSTGELIVRIRTQLHRRSEAAGVLEHGGVRLDVAAHRASVRGRDVPLAAREVALLAAFLRHPGRVLTREQLLRIVWQIDFDPRSNVVDVYVSTLRRKLGKGVIETVRGLGYRLPARLPGG
jgi:two-component system, OmpR family, response regulator